MQKIPNEEERSIALAEMTASGPRCVQPRSYAAGHGLQQRPGANPASIAASRVLNFAVQFLQLANRHEARWNLRLLVFP